MSGIVAFKKEDEEETQESRKMQETQAKTSEERRLRENTASFSSIAYSLSPVAFNATTLSFAL